MLEKDSTTKEVFAKLDNFEICALALFSLYMENDDRFFNKTKEIDSCEVIRFWAENYKGKTPLNTLSEVLQSHALISNFHIKTKRKKYNLIFESEALKTGNWKIASIGDFEKDYKNILEAYDKINKCQKIECYYDGLIDEIGQEQKSLYKEGSSQQIILKIKERNRSLSLESKRKDDFKCQACGFEFHKNIVESHHLNPVSGMISEVLNTVDDLVTLCPTCHRVAHYLLAQNRNPNSEKYKELRDRKSLLEIMKKLLK